MTRRFVMVAIATTMLAACSIGDTEQAATEGGVIVVTGEDGSVSLVDPDGGEPEEIGTANEPGVSVQATPSNEDGTIVWTEMMDGQPVVAVYDGSEVSHIESPTAPFFYMFSPDDTQLVALGNNPDGDGVALLVVDTSTSTVELVDTGQPYFVTWDEDSDGLAAHIGPDLIAQLGLDGARTAIDAVPGPYQAPQWLPDGRLLGVVITAGITASLGAPVAPPTGSASLAAIEPDSGEFDRLVDIETWATFEANRDGSRIALVDGLGPSGISLGALEVVSVSGDESGIVADGGVVAFEWSRDGEKLLYHTVEGDQGLVPHVWDGEESTDYAAYDPTGVLFREYLPFWSQYVQTITQWSPDGSAFVYASPSDTGDSTIWVQPTNGERRRVASGEMAVWSRTPPPIE